MFDQPEKTEQTNKKKKRGRNCQTTIKLNKNDFKDKIKKEEQTQSIRPSKNDKYYSRKSESISISQSKSKSKSKSKSNTRANNKIKIKRENNIVINNENENDQTKIFECLEEIRSTLQHSFNLFGNLVGLLKNEMNKNNKNTFLKKKTNRNKKKIQLFEQEEKAFSLMDLDEDYQRNNFIRNKIDDDEDFINFNFNKKDKKNQRKKGK